MEKRHRTALVVSVLLVILAFHLSVAWQSMGTLARNGFLYDDGFYAFKIAQNIAAGRGVTFDGIHPTTGFQPLYVFLLVPAFLISGTNALLPIYMILTLMSVFTCLTAYLVYRLSRRYVGAAASSCAAIIWAFSPIVTRQSANGLETAVAAFMIALSVLYYLERIRSVENPRMVHFAALGILFGLTILARIDGVLLVLAVLLDYLLLLRKKPGIARHLARLSIVPLLVLILYGPWLVFNLIVCGSPLQDSGTATRFLSLAYASYFGYGPANLGSTGPDFPFIWTHITHAIATMKVIPPVHVVFRSMDRLGGAVGAGGAFHAAGNGIGFLMLIGAIAGLLMWRRNEGRARRRELDFLLLFSALLVASYAMYVFGMFFFLRYYYPVYLVACVYSAFFLQDAFDWCSRRSLVFRRAIVAVAAMYALLFAYFSCSQAYRSRPIYPFYDIARWVEANTREGEKIGVFQCGTIGYLSHRQVINLDGKVNREALDAMKKGCLESYLREEGIDVVVDHSRILEIFLGNFRGSAKGSCTDVVCGSLSDPSGWVAYRPPEKDRNEDARAMGGGGQGNAGAPLHRNR